MLNNIALDFKAIIIFNELMRRRKVSDVADELNTSQPSVSRYLARLREHFDDQLFVKTQHAMEPTPRAIAIAPYMEQMLDLYFSQLSQKSKFDPVNESRTFRIAASEVGHVLLFPSLIELLAKQGPHIKLTAVPLGLHSLIRELETGEADIAIGAFPELYAGVYERTLFTETYTCVARRDHPDFKGEITLEQFRNAKHIVVSASGLGHIHGRIEKKLYEICPEENVTVVSHSFLASALLAERTNLIVTLPSRVLNALGRQCNLQTLTPPVELPPFEVKQYWHERFNHEPANKWIRRTIAGLFK
jgi:DNA-binding transcriptional LysR family regulator